MAVSLTMTVQVLGSWILAQLTVCGFLIDAQYVLGLYRLLFQQQQCTFCILIGQAEPCVYKFGVFFFNS